MSTTTVLYVLEAGGNLSTVLPQIAAGLDAVKRKAVDVAAGTAVGMQAAGAAFGTFASTLQAVSRGVFKAYTDLAKFGKMIDNVLKSNDDWAQSTYRLSNELDRLKKATADTWGTTAAKFLDAFTLGLVYLVTLAQNMLIPAFTTFGDLLGLIKARITDVGTFIADIMSGDFMGAVSVITGAATDDIQRVTDAFNDAAKGWSAARMKAIAAAYETYGRATDGKSDIPIKSIKLDADAQVFRPLWEALIKLSSTIDEWMPKLDKVPASIQESVDKIQNAFSNLPELMKQTRYGIAANNVTGAVSAAQGGISGIATAFGGPIGALVGALLDAFNNLPDLIQGLSDQALQIFVGLPGQLATILGTTLPHLIVTLIPQLVQAFFLLPTQIGLEVAKSFPALVVSMIELIPDIALEFASSMEKILSSLFSPAFWLGVLRVAWNDLTAHLKATFGNLGGILGTHLGADAAGHRSLFGVHIPKLDDGGVITRTGLAMVHQGERYLGAPGSSTARATAGASSGPVFNIASLTIGDIRSIADALRRQRGSFGTGLRIDAYGG